MKNLVGKHAVIMCVYNGDKVDDLSLAVQSILEQTIKADLYIYIDGKINDALEEYIQSVNNVKGITIFRGRENKGLAFGLNYLIDFLVTQDYDFVSRMDSDDISLDNRLALQENFLLSHPGIHVLGGYCSEFGSSYALQTKKVPVEHEDLIKFSILRCPFIHPTVMFRTEVFKDGWRYPLNTTFSEDLALWYNLLFNGYRFGNIPKVLLKYRINDATLNRRKGIKKAFSELQLRFEYMSKMNLFSVKSVSLLLLKTIFHLMPLSVTKFFYKKIR